MKVMIVRRNYIWRILLLFLRVESEQQSNKFKPLAESRDGTLEILVENKYSYHYAMKFLHQSIRN